MCRFRKHAFNENRPALCVFNPPDDSIMGPHTEGIDRGPIYKALTMHSKALAMHSKGLINRPPLYPPLYGDTWFDKLSATCNMHWEAWRQGAAVGALIASWIEP